MYRMLTMPAARSMSGRAVSRGVRHMGRKGILSDIGSAVYSAFSPVLGPILDTLSDWRFRSAAEIQMWAEDQIASAQELVDAYNSEMQSMPSDDATNADGIPRFLIVRWRDYELEKIKDLQDLQAWMRQCAEPVD